MLLVMALLAAQAQAANGQVAVEAKPRGTSPWILNDDYPVQDARRHHEGTVEYRLHIDTSGRAVKCDVLASSGFAGLDDSTCVLLMRRGRFDPARDAAGAAVESDRSGRFTWRLGASRPSRDGIDGSAGSVPVPPAGQLELTVAALPSGYRQPVKAGVLFDKDHRVTDCRIVESSGSAAVDRAACAQLRLLSPDKTARSAPAAGPQEYIVSFRVDAPAKP